MMKILANDGLGSAGSETLRNAGFTLVTEKVEQENLIDEINKNKYDALLVRSATNITKELIDSCKSIKLIARVGTGMDHIQVEYAMEKGIKVLSTPLESSPAVAELVFAHLFSINRRLFDSNRNLHRNINDFKIFKKRYKDGTELNGKTIGIMGFGRIGQEVAKRALGLGMNVLAYDKFIDDVTIKLLIPNLKPIFISIETKSLEIVLKNSDFITLHLPFSFNQKSIITKNEINMMKEGAILINASKGGVIDEDDLIEALKSGKISHAGLDVFCDEPHPRKDLIELENVSITPHVGGATIEAQERISITLSEQIIMVFNKI